MDGSIYVNRESGALVKIGPVDDHYAQQVVVTGSAAGGSYKIPIAEYDRTFVEHFRPAGPDDLVALDDPSVRPPANATPEWLEEGSTGHRTLESAIARIEAMRDRLDPEGIDSAGVSPGQAARGALEDALAELRSEG